MASRIDEIGGSTQVKFSGILPLLARLRDPFRMTMRLFRRDECFIKTRLATIGRVAMNDPAFRRFVDSRNRRANLIGRAFRG